MPSLITTPRCTGPLAARPARPSNRASSRVVMHADMKGDFGEDIKRIAKKIQGSLPIIGLISRLTAVDGGFDDLAYPEFTRALLERAPDGFAVAVEDLERAYGKPASRRYVTFCCWLAEAGTGLVPTTSLLASARRVRVTEDLAVECERFEANKEEAVKKYQLVSRPEAPLRDKLGVALDCLCRCALNLEDGVEVPAQHKAAVSTVLRGAFGAKLQITDAMLEEIYGEREARAKALGLIKA